MVKSHGSQIVESTDTIQDLMDKGYDVIIQVGGCEKCGHAFSPRFLNPIIKSEYRDLKIGFVAEPTVMDVCPDCQMDVRVHEKYGKCPVVIMPRIQ